MLGEEGERARALLGYLGAGGKLTCSVPTKLWPRRRASSCASITTLMAFSVKRCNTQQPLEERKEMREVDG